VTIRFPALSGAGFPIANGGQSKTGANTMNSDNIVREVSRIANGLEELVRALVTELTMHEELIARLEKRLTELYAQGSQSVSIKIDGDIGERLEALELRIDDFITEADVDQKIEDAISDKVSDLDLDDKIGEYVNNLTFTVTVD
jgi:hypothetical protein